MDEAQLPFLIRSRKGRGGHGRVERCSEKSIKNLKIVEDVIETRGPFPDKGTPCAGVDGESELTDIIEDLGTGGQGLKNIPNYGPRIHRKATNHLTIKL